MSRNFYNNESFCCNNNYCAPYNGYGNASSNLGSYLFYMIAIFLLFGGSGFGPGNFWGDYNKIFRCSGFSNAWCDNVEFNKFNKFNNGIFSNGNFANNNFGNNNPSNTNISNTALAGLLGSLSGNSNFDIGNLADSYK